MRWQGTAWRAHHPRWSWAPLSGEGAALKGGRFNPAGVPALYLALSIEGMWIEMGHGFAHRLDPLTVCAYEVDVDGITDLRDASGADLAAMGCPWALDRAEGRKPASWAIAQRLIAEGVSGILVPSFANHARPGMANLVLWRWGPQPPRKVTVHDPSGRLPRNDLSWKS
ncbi:RES family NAD+ phosphorylase [Roseococcus sp.]|uniref:RES family NAD+ phosphorylase n=1 Tax=Roseococcus sp. TaxID=2109646 RepID=UPI003BAAF9C5